MIIFLIVFEKLFIKVAVDGLFFKLFKIILNYTVNQIVTSGKIIAVLSSCCLNVKVLKLRISYKKVYGHSLNSFIMARGVYLHSI